MQLPTPMPVDPFNEDYTLSQSTRLHKAVFGRHNTLNESLVAERLAGHESAFRFPMDYTLAKQHKAHHSIGRLIAKLAHTDKQETKQLLVTIGFMVASVVGFIVLVSIGLVIR